MPDSIQTPYLNWIQLQTVTGLGIRVVPREELRASLPQGKSGEERGAEGRNAKQLIFCIWLL